jgi:3-oxoacyl-[acyl-carrier-protein] synthase-1
MRRVVVTGIGIVSPIGNNADEVLDSLRAGRSGIEFVARDGRARLPQQGRGHASSSTPPAHIDKRRRCASWGRAPALSPTSP